MKKQSKIKSAKELALSDISHDPQNHIPLNLITAKLGTEILPKQEVISIDILKKLEDSI